MPSTLQGTVSEFDPQGGVGIIDADDGDLVLFNAANLRLDAAALHVGTRVQFKAHDSELGPHADTVVISC